MLSPDQITQLKAGISNTTGVKNTAVSPSAPATNDWVDSLTKDTAVPTTPTTPTTPNIYNKVGSAYKSFSGGANQASENISKDWQGRAANIIEGVDRNVNEFNKASEATPPGQIDKFGTVIKKTGNLLNVGLQTAGNVAGGAMDVFKEMMHPVISSIADQVGNNKDVQGIASSDIVGKLLDVVPHISKAYNDFKTKHPDLAANIEAGANIVGAGAGNEGNVMGEIKAGNSAIAGEAKSAAGAVADTAKGFVGDTKNAASDLYKAITTKSPEQIDAMITKNFEKGVKPSVAGKGTASQLENYQNKAIDAVKTIVTNKDNLKITDQFGELTGKSPRNLNEFSQAIEQTKENIFKQYDALAKEAGDAGAKVDLNPVAEELNKIGADPVIKDLHPEVIKYAEARAKALTSRGTYTTQQAQQAVQTLNKSLEAFYKNPSYETASKATVDALVANKLRSGLDEAIENNAAPGYQALKNKYGSLKTIEKDVVHRAIVDARKNAKGLLDFTDIFSAAEAVKGLATMNPASFAVGGMSKLAAMYYKYLNNPNTAISRLFKGVESSMTKGIPGEILTPPQPIFPIESELKASNDITPNPSIKSSPKSMMQKFKDIPNKQGGFIKNPFSGKVKIHPEDLSEMRDFTDYVNGAYKPKNPVQAEVDARRMAERYGMNPNVSNKVLSNNFGKLLDKKKFLKN